ncbi:MAG: hypothetical protein D6780_07610 [Candidatus Dadabacteria bacterium]|nr:MAG: hypothetical protein D6780_07610 [Candidatus Dadabacteria bacterium]
MTGISKRTTGTRQIQQKARENSDNSFDKIAAPSLFPAKNIITAVQERKDGRDTHWAEKALNCFSRYLHPVSQSEIKADALQPLAEFLKGLNRVRQISIADRLKEGLPTRNLIQREGTFKTEEELFHFLTAVGKTVAKIVGISVNCHLFAYYVAQKYPTSYKSPLSRRNRQKVLRLLAEAVDDKTFFENIFHQDVDNRSWLRLVLDVTNKPILYYLRLNKEAWNHFKDYLKDRYPSLKQVVRFRPSSLLLALTVGFKGDEKENEAFLKFVRFLSNNGIINPYLKENDFPLTKAEASLYCSERAVGRRAARHNKKLLLEKLKE